MAPVGAYSFGRVVLAQLERVLDQAVAAPGADDATEALAGAGRRVESGPALGARAWRVGERVGERHEVEEVVRVQVRDHDRVDRGVVGELAQLREHAVAAVQEQAEALVLDEVPRAGAAGVLPGGRFTEDRDPHPCQTLPV